MKPPILVGVLILAVALAAGILAPQFRSAQSKVADEAAELSELARRQSTLYATKTSRIDRLANMSGLKAADFDRLVAQSEARFSDLAPEFTKASSDAAARDRQHGLATSIKSPGVGAGGIRGAVDNIAKQLADDAKLLADAEKNAKAALAIDPSSFNAQQVLGSVLYLKASVLFGQSKESRRDLARQRARLLELGSDYKFARGNIDHFAGLDVKETVAKLRADLDEIAGLETKAAGEVDSLKSAIAQRGAELDQTRKDLLAASTELRGLQDNSFKAGDDAAFSAYRSKHRELSQRMQSLQQKEEQLDFGGIKGGAFASDETMSGQLSGGEPVVSVAELKRRLETATTLADGYGKSRQEIEKQIKMVEARGQAAGGAQAGVQAQMDKISEQLKVVQKDVSDVAIAAYNEETAALTAAQASVNAYKAAGSSISNWLNTAAIKQRESDPERKNERLKMIGNAENQQFMNRIGPSAEAGSKMLVAGIHAQRVDDLSRQLEAMDRFAEMLPGSQFDPKAIDEAIKTARDEATKVLGEVIDTYETLEKSGGNAVWIPQADLALVHYMLSKVDTPNAETHMGKTAEYLAKALEKREHWPYMAAYVAFRDHLKQNGSLPDVPSAPVEKTEEPAKP